MLVSWSLFQRSQQGAGQFDGALAVQAGGRGAAKFKRSLMLSNGCKLITNELIDQLVD